MSGVFQGRFCPQHQVMEQRYGCPVCRQEELDAREQEQRAFWMRVAKIVVPLLLISAWYLSRPEPPKDVRLSADDYRAAIEKAETALYSAARDEYPAAAESFRELGVTIGDGGSSAFHKEAGLDLQRLAVQLSAGTQNPDYHIANTRLEWERLRLKHFGAAPWYRTSSPALAQADAEEAAASTPPDVFRYHQTVADLRAALSQVQSAMAGWDPHGGTLDAVQTERLERAREALKQDIAAVRATFPEKLFRPTNAWRHAYERLTHATRTVETVLGPSHRQWMVPTGYDLSQRYTQAEYAIGNAETVVRGASAP